jgi:hypothetical protein
VAGNYTATVNVTDETGYLDARTTTFEVVPPTVGPLQVLAFWASPPVIVVGDEVNFTVIETGGEAPIAYEYAELPSGCMPASAPTFSCYPGSLGTFQVTVTVGDGLHRTVSAATTLTVSPPPTHPIEGTNLTVELPAAWWPSVVGGLLIAGLGATVGAIAVSLARWVRARRRPPEGPA